MRLLEAVVVLAVAGEAFAAPPVLDSIEVVGHQASAVRLHLSAPAVAAARPLPPLGDAPHRIYVDLAGAAVAPALNRLVAGAGPLLRVRAGQFDKTTARVVLDLAGAVPFTVRQTGQTITIELGQLPAVARPARVPETAAPPVIATARQPETARPLPLPQAAEVRPKEAPAAPAVPAPALVAPGGPRPPASAAPVPVAPTATASAPPVSVAPPPPGAPQRNDAPPAPPIAAPGVHDRGATVMPPVVASPPPAGPPPAAAIPTERHAPPSEAAAVQPPARDPTPEPPVMPLGAPPRLPSLSALPGALIALQNGRELAPRAPASPPAPESAPPPAPPPVAPAAVAAVAPPSPPPAAPSPNSFVGPPAPPAAAPEPTKLARATPAPVERAGPERPRAPTTAVRRRPATRQPHPLVVLDAGHGGRDPGAEGVGGILEKDVVLEVTRLVARRLAARLPVDVVMTRSDDSFLPIERRLALPGEGATLFISMHANACTDPTARGLEVFYGGGAVQTASMRGGNGPAEFLGRCLDKALEARIGGVRGGPRPGTFGVLVRNPVPSALIEIGYLTHPGEAARAQDTAFHELLADAVVDGVATFLRASAPPL